MIIDLCTPIVTLAETHVLDRFEVLTAFSDEVIPKDPATTDARPETHFGEVLQKHRYGLLRSPDEPTADIVLPSSTGPHRVNLTGDIAHLRRTVLPPYIRRYSTFVFVVHAHTLSIPLLKVEPAQRQWRILFGEQQLSVQVKREPRDTLDFNVACNVILPEPPPEIPHLPPPYA